MDYCRLVARAKSRRQFEAVLMFLTLSQRGSKESQMQMHLPEQMDLLKEVIGDSLRVGDAYTRYGNRHFILMLVNIEQEFCATVFQRLKAYFPMIRERADILQEIEGSPRLSRQFSGWDAERQEGVPL